MNGTEEKRSIANITITRAEELALKMQAFMDQLESKLYPVLEMAPPAGGEADKKDCAIRNYPPLFDGLRDSFDTIEDQLDRLARITGRIEL